MAEDSGNQSGEKAELLEAEAKQLAAKVDSLARLYGVAASNDAKDTLRRLCELRGVAKPDGTHESAKQAIGRLCELAGLPR